MIIWSGFGIIIVFLFWAGIAATGFASQQGWIPDTPYQLSIGMLVSAVLVWILGKPLQDPDGRNRHSLFFIPWTYWPLLILAAGAFTGWSSYSLDAAVRKDPLGFEITNQDQFDAAATVFFTEKERLRIAHQQRASLSAEGKKKLDQEIAKFKRRQQELSKLSSIYEVKEIHAKQMEN